MICKGFFYRLQAEISNHLKILNTFLWQTLIYDFEVYICIFKRCRTSYLFFHINHQNVVTAAALNYLHFNLFNWLFHNRIYFFISILNIVTKCGMCDMAWWNHTSITLCNIACLHKERIISLSSSDKYWHWTTCKTEAIHGGNYNENVYVLFIAHDMFLE